MSIVLQVSDPHFGTEQQPVVEALVRFCLALEPDVLLMSGDITQRARRAQFAAARRFVDRLAVPARVVIPGNHDIPLFNLFARVFSPYGNHRREFGEPLEGVYQSDDLLLIGLNSTRARRHKDGELSHRQIEATAAQLRAARPPQLRVIATHQPLHSTRLEDDCNLLHGHEHAVRAWSLAGADLLVAGHIHLPFVRPISERHQGLPRELWAANAGTAVSSRIREGLPNSVSVIRSGSDCGEAGHFSVEINDYSAAHQGFLRSSLNVIPMVR
jgi:3',5'-cyclic AMP phosphodiesterase CpdA